MIFFFRWTLRERTLVLALGHPIKKLLWVSAICWILDPPLILSQQISQKYISSPDIPRTFFCGNICFHFLLFVVVVLMASILQNSHKLSLCCCFHWWFHGPHIAWLLKYPALSLYHGRSFLGAIGYPKIFPCQPFKVSEKAITSTELCQLVRFTFSI